jgi:hypothetical protein
MQKQVDRHKQHSCHGFILCKARENIILPMFERM